MDKFFSSLKRASKSGYKSFIRNFGLNIATVFVMFLAITIITFLFLLGPISDLLISNIKEKINISIYFEEGVKPEEIIEIRNKILEREDVKDAEYISSEEAFDRFAERYKDNFTIMSSLSEIGTNPFLSSINIKAYDVDNYQEINTFLEEAPFRDLINKIDYEERRPVIERVSSMAQIAKNMGYTISLFFGIIAIIFAFSAIKSAIYNSKEEISIMKLVGASNWFIKIPFLIQGSIIGFLSGFLSLVLVFLFSYFLDDKIESFLGISLFFVFISNLLIILFIQFGTGIILGIISSFIAVKMHLSKL